MLRRGGGPGGGISPPEMLRGDISPPPEILRGDISPLRCLGASPFLPPCVRVCFHVQCTMYYGQPTAIL